MFKEWYEKNINSVNSFVPFFPDINDREKWENIDSAKKERLIADADIYYNFDWPTCKASDHLRFHTDGDRSAYEKTLFKKRDALTSLVLGQCVLGTDNKKYAMDILNGIVAICEESYWGAAAHCHLFNPDAPYWKLFVQNRLYPILDLFTAETGNLLSWTKFLLKDFRFYDCDDGTLGVQLWERVDYEIKTRVLTPYYDYDFYWWMGLDGNRVNNWNPWITCNVVSCLLNCGTDTEYIKNYLHKVFTILENYYNSIYPDGGCDEGPLYWFKAGNALFQTLYELYRATNGQINFFDDKKIKNIGSYLVKAHAFENIFANFADSHHKVFENPVFVSLYGKYTNNNDMILLGEDLKKHFNTSENPSGRPRHFSFLLKCILEELFEEIPTVNAQTDTAENYYLPDLQFASLKQKNNDGFIVFAKGGNNDESHNHNDIGNFIVYADKKPLFIDAGVETYTQKTFSEHRYELWTMQSGWHNVPIVNGAEQPPGAEYKAENCNLSVLENSSVFSVDFKKAYDEKSYLSSLNRSIILENDLKITDKYIFTKNQNSITQVFLSVIKPQKKDSYIEYILDSNKKAILEFDRNSFDVVIEEKKIADRRLQADWGNKIYRTKLIAEATEKFVAEYLLKIV